MRYCITGKGAGPSLEWKLESNKTEKETSVIIQHVRHTGGYIGRERPENREQGLKALRGALAKSKTDWIAPDVREWILDLDKLGSAFPPLNRLAWFRGKVLLEPQFEWGETAGSQDMRESARWQERWVERTTPPGCLPVDLPESSRRSNQATYESRVWFVVVPEVVERKVILLESPPELENSLRRFRADFRHPKQTAFIIMRFGQTEAQDQLLNAIKTVLRSHGLDGVRADEKQYSDDLLLNVRTFMHGCGFAIAVFERAEEETFSPNVALELGYLLAIGKPVCLLKDRRLETLPTDLTGKLYSTFDPGDPSHSIAQELTAWLQRNELARPA